MGPLSGVGDAFYWGTLRILATGVGRRWRYRALFLGPILFLLVFNVPHHHPLPADVCGGYRFGSDMIRQGSGIGIMDTLIVKMASIMGAMMVMGAMTMEMVTVDIPLMVGAGDGAPDAGRAAQRNLPGLCHDGAVWNRLSHAQRRR